VKQAVLQQQPVVLVDSDELSIAGLDGGEVADVADSGGAVVPVADTTAWPLRGRGRVWLAERILCMLPGLITQENMGGVE
jgi:hypothetical protein